MMRWQGLASESSSHQLLWVIYDEADFKCIKCFIGLEVPEEWFFQSLLETAVRI
jgi:hypothetical protein